MKLGKSKPPEVRGFLDDGTEIIGDLRFTDVLQFHGRFKGRIISDGTLVVGESGVIEGEVEVGTLTLSGTIKGNILARERVHLLKTSRVIGDVGTPILKVDEGASWEGTISTMSSMAKEEKKMETKALEEMGEEKQKLRALPEAKEVKKVG